MTNEDGEDDEDSEEDVEDDGEDDGVDGDLARLGGINLNAGCAGLILQIQLRLGDITFLVLVWGEIFTSQKIKSLYCRDV